MKYKVLARRLRPQSFDKLLGQDEVIQTLKNALKSQRIGSAYLFYGPRGTGKTTVARIFAKALNCHKGISPEPCQECISCIEIREGNSLDVHEIDGATYTQVDKIREIKEMVYFQPARDRYKIYIIDEVHMLSQSAFNAILKLLEEPPPHAVFIFATTEKYKIPATILSRCQTFNFHLFSLEEIVNYLKKVIKEEKVEASEPSLLKIAKKAKGSIRDALSILDQVINLSGEKIDEGLVSKLLGETNIELLSSFLKNISEGNSLEILKGLEEVFKSGEDFFYFYESFLAFLRNILKAKLDQREPSLSEMEWGIVKKTGDYFRYEEVLRAYSFALENQILVNKSEYPYIAVELIFLKLCELPKLKFIEEVMQGNVSISQVKVFEKRKKSLWEIFLEEMEKKSKAISGYLQGVHFKEEEKELLVFFKSNFKIAYERCLDQENFDIIKSQVKKIWGEEFEVKLILEEEREKIEDEINQEKPIKALQDVLMAEIEDIEYLTPQKEEENREY